MLGANDLQQKFHIKFFHYIPKTVEDLAKINGDWTWTSYKVPRSFVLWPISEQKVKIWTEGKEGENIASMETLVNYETMITPWDSCHKISVRNISNAPWSGIKINFNESVLDLPQLNIQIMDEENSYGIIYGRMMGKAITYPVEFGKALWVQLQPEKFKYLSNSQSSKSTCGHRSY